VRSWGLSVQEQDELWTRWRQGESLRLIARRMGKRGPSVRAFVLQSGGIQQPPRQRPARSLSAAEREEISRWGGGRRLLPSDRQAAGTSALDGVAGLARNGGRLRYRAQRADAAACQRAARPKACKLAVEPRLRAVVEAKLALRWSPERSRASCGWPIPTTRPCGSPTRPSTSACMCPTVGYSAATCGVACAPAGRCATRGKRLPQGRGQLTNIVSIRQRPAEADDRKVPGHWEGDLVLGKRPSAVLTLVERTSRSVLLVAPPAGWRAEQVRPP
jgi:hypothetical protein